MDNTRPGSFIPKSPVKSSSAAQRPVRRVYILAYIAYLFFFGAVIAAAGVYTFQTILNNKLGNAQVALSAQRNQFNQDSLDQVTTESQRLAMAYGLLNSHFFVYSIFTALEQSTIQTVQLSDFTLKLDPTQNVYDLSFTATAYSMNDLLYQRATYMSNKILAGAQYTKVAITTQAGATGQPAQSSMSFTVTKSFKPSDLPLDPTLYQVSAAPSVSPVSSGTTSPAMASSTKQ